MGFYAFKATTRDGKTTGYGGGNLPLLNVLTLQEGKWLHDPCVTQAKPVRLGRVGLHVCPFPAQCLVFLPHAHTVWRVWVPSDAQCDACDCWQIAVSKLFVDRKLTEEEVQHWSHGVLTGPNGTMLSMHRGQLHSFDDQPSEITARGTRKWHMFGRLHRERDLPAVAFANGLGYWMKKDRFVRVEGRRVVGPIVEEEQAIVEM